MKYFIMFINPFGFARGTRGEILRCLFLNKA